MYNNYENNVVLDGNYPKSNIKGMIITISCMVTSIMVVLSMLMPIMSFETKDTVQSINIIDIIDMLIELIDRLSNMNTLYIGVRSEIFIVIALVILFIPIVILLVGIIFTIIYTIRLISGRYVKNGASFAWKIIIFEMLISTVMYLYIYVVYYLKGVSIADNIELSIGWYMPTIVSFILLLISYGLEVGITIRKEKIEKIVERVLSIVTGVLSGILYVSFASSHFDITQKTEEIDLPYSFLLTAMLESWDILLIVINILLVVIAIMVNICLIKNIRNVISGRFSASINIVVGSMAIIFTIVNTVLFDKYIEENYNKYVIPSMGTAGYMYIIMGTFLIVIGVIYICIKIIKNNKQNMKATTYCNQNQVNAYGDYMQQHMITTEFVNQQNFQSCEVQTREIQQ